MESSKRTVAAIGGYRLCANAALQCTTVLHCDTPPPKNAHYGSDPHGAAAITAQSHWTDNKQKCLRRPLGVDQRHNNISCSHAVNIDCRNPLSEWNTNIDPIYYQVIDWLFI